MRVRDQEIPRELHTAFRRKVQTHTAGESDAIGELSREVYRKSRYRGGGSQHKSFIFRAAGFHP